MTSENNEMVNISGRVVEDTEGQVSTNEQRLSDGSESMHRKLSQKLSNGSNQQSSGYSLQGEDHTPDPNTSNSNKTTKQPDSHGSSDSDNEDADKLDLSCGIGRLRTNILGDRFANLYVFAVCFGISNLFAMMVGQVIQVQLTSLERQFNIDNARAGLFETAARIGFISTLLFAGHFAKKYHIPLIVGTAGVLQGFVLTIPAIMQFLDPYELPVLPPTRNLSSNVSSDLGDSAKYLCEANDVLSGNVTNSTGEVKHAQFIAIIAIQAAKGLTDTFHNGFLPILYMDDNLVDKTKMGIILGIWQVITELSGPIGKQVNGMISEVPIDLKPSEMDPDDRRFISAWWLGYLVFGIGIAVFSFPIILFPRSLVTARQQQAALDKAMVTFAGGEIPDEVAGSPEGKQQESEASVESVVSFDAKPESEDAPDMRRGSYNVSSFKKNASRRGSTIHRFSGSRRPSLFPPVEGPTVRKVSITGDLVFNQPIKKQDSVKEEDFKELLKDFPRALIRVFKKPVVLLILFDITIVSIPFSGTSMFRNTYMQNEYNISMAEVALVSAITTAIGNITGTVVSSLVSARVTTKIGYVMLICWTWLISLTVVPLYFVFGCGNEVVYGAEGEFGRQVNLTSCNCSSSHQLLSCGDDLNNYISPCYAGCQDVDGKFFTGCNLINITFGSSVKPGLCATECHTNFIIYAALHGFQYFFLAMSMVPRRLLLLRIVDPQDRGFITSLFSFFWVLTGIPSTNLFGSIIDDTCLIWDGDYCSLYDRDKIRYLMSGIDISVHSSTQLCFLIMLVIFKCEEIRAKKNNKKQTDDIEIQVTPEQEDQTPKTENHNTTKTEENHNTTKTD